MTQNGSQVVTKQKPLIAIFSHLPAMLIVELFLIFSSQPKYFLLVDFRPI
jgi:hypothetical protein